MLETHLCSTEGAADPCAACGVDLVHGRSCPILIIWALIQFSYKKTTLFVISTVKLGNFLLYFYTKTRAVWWHNPWDQVKAACRLLCYSKLADFMLQPRIFVQQSTAGRSGWTYRTVQAAQHEPGPAQVDCYVDCCLLDIQCSSSQDDYNTLGAPSADLMQVVPVSAFCGNFVKFFNCAHMLFQGISAKMPCSFTVWPGLLTEQLPFCNSLVHTKLLRH